MLYTWGKHFITNHVEVIVRCSFNYMMTKQNGSTEDSEYNLFMARCVISLEVSLNAMYVQSCAKYMEIYRLFLFSYIFRVFVIFLKRFNFFEGYV